MGLVNGGVANAADCSIKLHNNRTARRRRKNCAMIRSEWQFSLLFAAVLLLFFRPPVAGQISGNDVPSCEGVFDFYFVLDRSGSVEDAFHTEIVPFVVNVTNTFISPDFRISFITFSDDATVLLPLTQVGNRSAIIQGIGRLNQVEPGGATNLAPGLLQVNSEIDVLGGDTASVVLVLTDGKLNDETDASNQANIARMKGASIFAIGVGEVDINQLLTIADDEDQLFIGMGFESLGTILEKVINETCTEITAIEPERVCLGNQETGREGTKNLTLIGRGFTNQLSQDNSLCRFMTEMSGFFVTRPSQPVQYDRIVCSVPTFNTTGEVLLQVSLNGITFISSNVTLQIDSCEAQSKGFVAGIVLSLLVVFVLVGVCLLWFLFPLIAGVRIVGGLPPEPREEVLKGTPGRKWETVDASYYGGGGVGGIKPVTVRWGKGGATEEGAKLSKAKDANVVDVKEIPGTPAPYRATPTCWTLFKKRVRRWYAVAASYRPIKTETNRVLCCPGTEYYSGKYTVFRNLSVKTLHEGAPKNAATSSGNTNGQSEDELSASVNPPSRSSSTSAPVDPPPPPPHTSTNSAPPRPLPHKPSTNTPARPPPRTASNGAPIRPPPRTASSSATARPPPRTASSSATARLPPRTASSSAPARPPPRTASSSATARPPPRTASSSAPIRPAPPKPGPL